MKVLEPKVMLDHLGIMSGDEVEKSVKHYQDVSFLYENPREDNPVVYEVYSYTQSGEEGGNLNWGLTDLKPVYSNGECNMTKGHFHVNKDCAEYYFCTQGHGLLLLMDETGKTWAEEMKPGSLHYINGHYAHRCVNTGDDDLIFGACWPVRSGHDYESVEKREFGYRIKKDGDRIVYEKR